MRIVDRFLGESYFFLLGLETGHVIYYIEENGMALGSRLSGVLHLTLGDQADMAWAKKMLLEKHYDRLYMSKKQFERITLDVIDYDDGAYIAKREPLGLLSKQNGVRSISRDDVVEVENLYHQLFDRGYAKADYMTSKFENQRGRAYGIKEDGQIISICQSDFETNKGAIIAGVGTSVKYQKQGLGSKVMKHMLQELDRERKTTFLLFDNLDAGKMYQRLGYQVVDQMITIKKENLLKVLR